MSWMAAFQAALFIYSWSADTLVRPYGQPETPMLSLDIGY